MSGEVFHLPVKEEPCQCPLPEYVEETAKTLMIRRIRGGFPRSIAEKSTAALNQSGAL